MDDERWASMHCRQQEAYGAMKVVMVQIKNLFGVG